MCTSRSRYSKTRCEASESLLEDVVDSSETLDGFVEHQQGDDEADELAGGHGAMLDLDAGVGDQADDGGGAEEFDDRRRDGLLAT